MRVDIRAWSAFIGSGHAVGEAGADGSSTQLTDVFGRADSRSGSPQVFLVEMPPRRVIYPHFHGVPQFQLVVDGSGKLGRHGIDGRVLHYTDAWTSYGPIEAGASGLSFFTIRCRPDVGAHYMPGQRDERGGPAGEQFTVALGATRAAAPDDTAQVVMQRASDGMSAHDITLRAGAPWHADPVTEASDHDYLLVVLDGSVRVGEREYAPWSWASVVSTVEDGAVVAGGSEGGRFLQLRFPDS
jgi:hypothetical protein